MINIFNYFVKITAYPVYLLLVNNKKICQDNDKSLTKIKGPAIIISNHTNLFDYVIWLFTFFNRTIRFQMAEVLFTKKPLCYLLRALGGIEVNRKTFDFSFMNKSLAILRNNGVVGIFPESRLPLPNEKRPLPFTSTAAKLALESQVQVIPVYTDGRYFEKKRPVSVIGKPINVMDYYDDKLSEKENISNITTIMYNKIVELEAIAYEKG